MNGVFPIARTCTSPQDTAALAARIAPLLRAGDTLLLDGDIGSGKTHFARAIIQTRLGKAGRAETVPSPTYTLVQAYCDGIVDIWHADLFRLASPDEVADLGLDDAFREAICLVEWPDRLAGQHPDGAMLIRFETCSEPGVRVLIFHASAPRWLQILPLIEHAATGNTAHV
jgi:tRNA threonylcarbamoyladenosine biosynthesis protein TsaE